MLALIALLTAPAAQASGYYTSDVGVRAFSRGGAYVAGADDLLALWYNPAALTRVDGGQVTVNVAGVGQDVTFDRQDYPGEGVDGADLITEPVENQAPYFVIPHLGIAWDFGLPDTTVALGFYPPYAPDFAYPSDGAQRYSLVDTVVIQTFTGISAAHELADWVSLGAGVSWNYLYTEQQLAVSLWTQTDSEHPDYDVAFSMDAKDSFAVGWNAGFLVEPPSEQWAVGGMVQAPTRFSATGTLSADFEDNVYYYDFGFIEQPRSSDDAITLDISMPLILKGGALVRPLEDLEIEAAVVWEGWGAIQEIVVSDVDMVVEMNNDLFEDVEITDDVVLPAGYQSTLSVRLGGHYGLGERFTLRAGGMYEGAAVPDRTLSVSLVDGDKFGYGLGGTWSAGPRLDVDAGLFQSFLPQRTITGSDVRQIVVDPLTGEIIEGRVVGDGVLTSHTTLFGVGLNYYFDRDS